MSHGKYALRIQHELKQLQQSDEIRKWIYLQQLDEDCNNFILKLTGPKNTPFEGECHTIILNIPYGFPFVGPQLIFKTKICHPNVDSVGNFCWNDKTTMNLSWSPANTILSTILAMLLILENPVFDNPLNIDAISNWHNDIIQETTEYIQKTTEYADNYTDDNITHTQFMQMMEQF